MTWRTFRLPEEEHPTAQLFPLLEGETAIGMLPLPPKEQAGDSYLVLATAQGRVKRTCVAELSLLEEQPAEVIGLGDDDELRFGGLTDGVQQVLLVSSSGQSIRFDENEIRPQVSPVARGVIGVRLGKADTIVGTALVHPEDQGELVSVSAKGYLKRTPLEDYPIQKRGGRGVRTANLGTRTGTLVAATVLQRGQKLSVLSRGGRRAFFAYEDVPQMGRGTQGRRLTDFGRQDAPKWAVAF